MIKRKINSGRKSIDGYVIPLGAKNLVLLAGAKGYVMCGDLNLSVAQKFGEAAIKITGVANVKDALKAKVHSLTSAAKRLGVYKGQSIKEVLRLIA